MLIAQELPQDIPLTDALADELRIPAVRKLHATLSQARLPVPDDGACKRRIHHVPGYRRPGCADFLSEGKMSGASHQKVSIA